MKSKKWKINKIPPRITEFSSELLVAWEKNQESKRDFKPTSLYPLLGGSTPLRLLHQQVNNKNDVDLTDLDWFMTGVTLADQSALEEHKEKFGNRLLEACEGAKLVPSTKDPITGKVLYYLINWKNEDVNMGPPVIYHNFSFLIDPKTGEVILDDKIPGHEADISLFFEENLIKSYHINKLTGEAYIRPHQVNILAWFIKSYYVLLKDFGKSFHYDTACELNTLFKKHPIIYGRIRQRLISHYCHKLKKFQSESHVDNYLSKLKAQVKILAKDLEPSNHEKEDLLREKLIANDLLKNEIEAAKLVLAKLDKDIEAAESSKAAIHKNWSYLKDDIAKFESEAETKALERKKQEDELSRVDRKLQSVSKENRSLKAKNQELENQLAKKQSALTQLTPPAPPVKTETETETEAEAKKIDLEKLTIFVKAIHELLSGHVFNGESLSDDFLNGLITSATNSPSILSPLQNKALLHLFEEVQTVEDIFEALSIFGTIINKVILHESYNSKQIIKIIQDVDTHHCVVFSEATLDKLSKPISRVAGIFDIMLRVCIVLEILGTTPQHKKIAKDIRKIADLDNVIETLAIDELAKVDQLVALLDRNCASIIQAKQTRTPSFETLATIIQKGAAKLQSGAINNVFERFIKLRPIMTVNELRDLLGIPEDTSTYSKWLHYLEKYMYCSAGMNDSDKEKEAVKCIQSLFALHRSSDTPLRPIITYMTYFVYHDMAKKETMFKDFIFDFDDPIFKCLSPLLNPRLHQQSRALDSGELAQEAVKVLRNKTLEKLRAHNILVLPTEILNDDEKLLEEHYHLMRAFWKANEMMVRKEIVFHQNVFSIILPKISTFMKPRYVSSNESGFLWKAGLFCTQDFDIANEYASLTELPLHLRNHLYIGNQLMGCSDDKIIELSRKIYEEWVSSGSEQSSAKAPSTTPLRDTKTGVTKKEIAKWFREPSEHVSLIMLSRIAETMLATLHQKSPPLDNSNVRDMMKLIKS